MDESGINISMLALALQIRSRRQQAANLFPSARLAKYTIHSTTNVNALTDLPKEAKLVLTQSALLVSCIMVSNARSLTALPLLTSSRIDAFMVEAQTNVGSGIRGTESNARTRLIPAPRALNGVDSVAKTTANVVMDITLVQMGNACLFPNSVPLHTNGTATDVLRKEACAPKGHTPKETIASHMSLARMGLSGTPPIYAVCALLELLTMAINAWSATMTKSGSLV